MFEPVVINGYNDTWYPPEEPVIPRVYHKYLKEDNKKNLYSPEEIGVSEAWFVSKPETYKCFGYAGSSCILKEVSVAKMDFKTTKQKLAGDTVDLRALKEVRVYNNSSSNSFVRVHLAIPSCLDDAQPNFNASYNMLHFNMKMSSLDEGGWNWGKAMDRSAGTITGASGYNFYEVTLNGVKYNVYVVTLETALAPRALSTDVIERAYIDRNMSDDDIAQVYEIIKSNEWEIKVAVETVPANDFEDPFEAFDAVLTKEVGSYLVF